ncbi:MAG: penicillin-binding protein 1C, partial [Chitinophagaceae bacterium]
MFAELIWNYWHEEGMVSQTMNAIATRFQNRRTRPGFDPLAFGRAISRSISSGHITSGGSTLTMQVIRLATQHKRTVWNKLREIFMALRLEVGYSKDEILALYAGNAPFGSNVVG